MISHVRTRFAPSPTGSLHMGGLRTALVNFLYAKSQNGKFFVRIEDTDRERTIENSERTIINTLDAFGIKSDEPSVRQV